MPRKRRVKEGGRLAHRPMGCERMAASVPPFPTSLANAGKMPALLEAGASRMPASRSARSAAALFDDDAIIGAGRRREWRG